MLEDGNRCVSRWKLTDHKLRHKKTQKGSLWLRDSEKLLHHLGCTKLSWYYGGFLISMYVHQQFVSMSICLCHVTYNSHTFMKICSCQPSNLESSWTNHKQFVASAWERCSKRVKRPVIQTNLKKSCHFKRRLPKIKSLSFSFVQPNSFPLGPIFHFQISRCPVRRHSLHSCRLGFQTGGKL